MCCTCLSLPGIYYSSPFFGWKNCYVKMQFKYRPLKRLDTSLYDTGAVRKRSVFLTQATVGLWLDPAWPLASSRLSKQDWTQHITHSRHPNNISSPVSCLWTSASSFVQQAPVQSQWVAWSMNLTYRNFLRAGAPPILESTGEWQGLRGASAPELEAFHPKESEGIQKVSWGL